MVRHLEHVGVHVDARGQHGLLRLDLGVARQQYPDTAHGRPHHKGRVVRIGPRATHGDAWSQHLQAHGSDVNAPAYAGRADRQLVIGEHVTNNLDTGSRFGERTGEHGTDLPAVEHAVDAADVVEVVVADDQQRDPVDVQVGQASIDGDRIRAGVDDHGVPRPGREHQCVALADVARHENPAMRRPAGDDGAHG